MRLDDGTEFDTSKIVPYAYRHTDAQRHADAAVADERRPSPGARLRGEIRAIREVIRKGWHERSRLGVLLRRLDRHLP